MPFLSFFSALLFFLACSITTASAEFNSHNEAGLKYTSNANLETTEPDSDFFLRMQSLNKWTQDSSQFSFRLTLFKYIKETTNDVFIGNLAARLQPFARKPHDVRRNAVDVGNTE